MTNTSVQNNLPELTDGTDKDQLSRPKCGLG
jgi:hypothetical protein